ncbi:kinase-like domain-containing protein [Mycena polygramma]|nr:kinase-like domain-containing protein [Mycena polygramma]
MPVQPAGAPDITKATNTRYNGELLKDEYFWRDHQRWLETCGYKLRPRYSPDWVPSWEGTSKHYLDCEDGLRTETPVVMDATRVSDSTLVVLKQIKVSQHPDELKLWSMLTTEPLASDSRNHCVPMYDVLHVPDDEDKILVVMPFLSPWLDPEFHTIGEVVDFFGQLIDGLQFIHEQNVAHRDCKFDNILMDSGPLYHPKSQHPMDPMRTPDWRRRGSPSTRTRRPVKYYIIDFGISKLYDPDQPRPLEHYYGGDKTLPEFQAGALCDPFASDIYCLGNTFREYLTHGGPVSSPMPGLSFLRPLVEEMVQDDPQLRPTINQVAERFSRVRSRLHWWTLRARAADADEGPLFHFWKRG